MDPKLTRFPAGTRPVDHRLDRVSPAPITVEHLCEAVEATPGTRIAAGWDELAEELQLGVEVYDPACDAWRVLVSLTDGEARIGCDKIEDPQSTTRRAVEQLARRLDACLVTEDGVVLIGGGEAAKKLVGLEGEARDAVRSGPRSSELAATGAPCASPR